MKQNSTVVPGLTFFFNTGRGVPNDTECDFELHVRIGDRAGFEEIVPSSDVAGVDDVVTGGSEMAGEGEPNSIAKWSFSLA